MPSTIVDSAILGDIFSAADMRAVFSDGRRTQYYLDIERALAIVQARLGIIPQEACDEIVKHCRLDEIDMARLKTQTERIGYPILGVVQQLVANCRNGLGEWCHWGATTQDITDTATIMQIRAGLELVERDLLEIARSLTTLARKYRDTPMAARSNLQQAVPITFGYKCACLLAAFQRHIERLRQMKPRVLVGEFGGAAGNLSSLGDMGLKTQEALCKELGLGQPEIAWHTVRDRIAEAGCFLGLVTGTLAKISMDVKLMMQTEVEEAFEPFHEGRGSSSTMPQKRNPIASAYIHGCAGAVRQHVAALLDANVADHERSTGPWQIEWITLPEIFCLTSGALMQTKHLVAGLQVSPENMRRNLDISGGLIVSEAVMMGLGPSLGRQRAHDVVYDICRQAIATKRPFLDLLAENPEIKPHMTREQLAPLVDPANYLGQCGEMTDRVLAGNAKLGI